MKSDIEGPLLAVLPVAKGSKRPKTDGEAEPATGSYLGASVLFDALSLPWKSSKKDDLHGC